jgi:YHS domain-containing protein
MKLPPIALGLIFALSIVTQSIAGSTANLAKGIILKGYDPVSYFNGAKPLKGNASIKTELEGVTYLFANQANRAEFLKSPQKYSPAYEGWCATAVAGGYKYDIDPENYKITNGRLFLFYKGWKGDAKKDWIKGEPNNIKTADANWPKVKTTEE